MNSDVESSEESLKSWRFQWYIRRRKGIMFNSTKFTTLSAWARAGIRKRVWIWSNDIKKESTTTHLEARVTGCECGKCCGIKKRELECLCCREVAAIDDEKFTANYYFYF